MATKLCPTCKERRIPEDQGECWPCFHAWLQDVGKVCTALDCPDHGKANRPGFFERIRLWWQWRELRKAEKKNAKLYDQETAGRRMM